MLYIPVMYSRFVSLAPTFPWSVPIQQFSVQNWTLYFSLQTCYSPDFPHLLVNGAAMHPIAPVENLGDIFSPSFPTHYLSSRTLCGDENVLYLRWYGSP